MKERVPNNNIVDARLAKLVSFGKIEDTEKNRGLLWDQAFWDKFVSMCDDDIVDYILSFKQPGNWNGWLYAACEKRRGLKPNR